MLYEYGKRTREVFEAFLFFFKFSLLCFGGVFNKTIIPLALVGYEMIIANSALCASLAIYHLISNARLWLIPKWPPFSSLLFAFKLALVASFLNSKFKRIFSLNEATRANLRANKRTLRWRPFWNKVYRGNKIIWFCQPG